MRTIKQNQYAANLTKHLEIESAERKAMEAARRMARLVGRIGRSQRKEA